MRRGVRLRLLVVLAVGCLLTALLAAPAAQARPTASIDINAGSNCSEVTATYTWSGFKAKDPVRVVVTLVAPNTAEAQGTSYPVDADQGGSFSAGFFSTAPTSTPQSWTAVGQLEKANGRIIRSSVRTTTEQISCVTT